MNSKYVLVRENGEQWINSPNNGGECCETKAETVVELNRLLSRIKRLDEFVDQLTNPKFTRDDLPKEALLQRIKRLEEATQDRDKEWFQVIESILGFHPVSITDALRIGIERIKKQKQRIKRLEQAGDELATHALAGGVPQLFMEFVENWHKAKEAKP